MPIEMTIRGLMPDPITNMPVVVLVEKDGERVLPIWIGVAEGNAIHLQIENIDTPRPMTHDLLKSVIASLGGAVDRVVVCELKDNTFYATIDIQMSDRVVTIDARPSDAIALALRTGTRVFVEESVMQSVKKDADSGAADVGRLQKWLEGLSDDELGKYKM
jgi:bifunctional DNase/RNase